MKTSLIKRLVMVAALALGLVAPLQALASWGPNRPTLTYNGPGTPGATHVVFNSFVNNPNYGDERTFLDAKPASNTAAGGYMDTMQVTPGQEVLLRVYVHNNADPSLNANGTGIARNTTVKITLPTASDRALRAVGYISATNADPNPVTDTVDFQTAGAAPFSLSYIPGTATIYNNAHPTGFRLGDDIVAGGTRIGYENMDGNLPGCFQYDATVTIKVKVNAPGINLTKQVTTPGSTNWLPTMDAKIGDTDSWLLTYKNTSATQVNDVIVKDTLPAHLQVVPGSVTLIDGNHPDGIPLTDTGLFTTGVNVGNLAANNGGGYIRYRTVVKSDFAANECDVNLVNQASAEASGVSAVKATASVRVVRTCQTTTPPTTPLPQTGMEGAATGALGTGALGYAVVAYRRSKQAVIDALKGIGRK